MTKWMIIGLFFLPIALLGQEEQKMDSLSLMDAVSRGLEHNFQIEIAELQSDVAELNNSWGEAGRYPSILLNVRSNNSLSDADNPASFLNGKYSNISVQPSLDVNWTLFNGFRVNITKEKLDQLQLQSEGNAVVVIENTIQSIVLGYYNAKLQMNKLKVLEDVLTLSRKRYMYQLERKDLGVSSTFDILTFQNAYLSDSSAYLMQELAYNNAVRNLNLLMAVDVQNEYVLTEQLSFEAPLYQLDDLMNKMKSNNQTLLNQYINIELANLDLQLAESSMYPVVSFNGGAAWQANRFELYGDFPRQSNGKTLNYYGNFTLSFTLFNGSKTKTAIQRAGIQETIANTNLADVDFSLTNQLISTYELYNAQIKMYNLAVRNVDVADLTMMQAEERYDLGSINWFNLRDIQMAYLNTAIANLDATYNLIETHTQLIRLTGGIIDEYKK